MGIALRTVQGSRRLILTQKIDWHQRLDDLAKPKQVHDRLAALSPEVIKSDQLAQHILNLKTIKDSQETFPKPKDIYNAVIRHPIISDTDNQGRDQNQKNKAQSQFILQIQAVETGSQLIHPFLSLIS